MAAIYKLGSKWVVKTSTSTYNLDSGDCILTETADGNYFYLKLNGETILNSSYTIVTNESGTLYTKPELVAILDQMLVANASGGTLSRVTATLTRPADTNNYAVGDLIGAATAKVKQVSTVSLTGGGGTAVMTGTGGLTKSLTYNTSPTQTAADFVTAHAAAYLALDISVVVTSNSADIIFTAANYDETFIAPIITNVSEDLSGAVTHTQANAANVAQKETITLSGTAAVKQKETVTVSGVAATKMKVTIPLTGTLPVKQKEIITITGTSGTFTVTGTGGFTNIATWNTDEDTTATDFVTLNAAEYLTAGVVVTASLHTIIFEASVAGVGFTAPICTDGATDLHGTVSHDTANVAAGTANLTVVGLAAKLITFNTNLTTTASDFVTSWATSYYLPNGIVLTSDTVNLILETTTLGVPFGVPDVVTLTGNLAHGTIEDTVSHVAVGTANVTGAGGLTKLLTFDTDAATTTLAFKTANAADYLAQGIVLTNSTDTLVFEANVAGTPFTAPVVGAAITGTVAGSTAHTLANVVVGTATITGTGISKTITFDTDAATTALAFKTANEAYYATLGVTLTNSTSKIVFTAAVAGTPFTAPVFTNVTGDIAGVLATTATDHYDNVTEQKQIETILVTGSSGTFIIGAAGGLTKTVTFDTNIQATIAAFISTNAALYLAQAIVLTGNATQIIMTAEAAGTGFTAPTIAGITENLTGTVVTTSSVSLLPITLSGMAMSNGGSGFIMDMTAETDAVQFASATLRVWLFNDIPSGVVGDNVAYVNLIADSSKRIGYFDCVIDALLVNSDCVIGKLQPNIEYVCSTDDTNLYVLVQTLTAITAPKSSGVFNFYFNTVKIN